MKFNTGGTGEKVRIDSDGKVGIGTDDPIAALDVRDASGSDPTLFIGHSNADVIGEAIRIGRVAPYNTIRYHSIKAEHSGGPSSNMLAFHLHKGGSPATDQIEVMRLRGDGKVGINQDAPTADLEVCPTGTGTTSTVFIHTPTHNTNAQSEAILKFGYGHSGSPDGVGHIKMVEDANNSFDADFIFGLPINNSSVVVYE